MYGKKGKEKFCVQLKTMNENILYGKPNDDNSVYACIHGGAGELNHNEYKYNKLHKGANERSHSHTHTYAHAHKLQTK